MKTSTATFWTFGLLLFIGSVALTVGCDTSAVDLQRFRYSCKADSDCLKPSVCVQSVCGSAVEPDAGTAPVTPDAGKDAGFTVPDLPDASVPDAGACTPKGQENCSTVGDEDCNGLADCLDATCAGQVCGNGCLCSNAASAETNCIDSTDNDRDGLTDCLDVDCIGEQSTGGLCVFTNGTTGMAETSCSGGADNDMDGLADCKDPDCLGRSNSAFFVTEFICGAGTSHEAQCFNNKDDDSDGKIDAADPDCCQAISPLPASCEFSCGNGLDDNGNNAADCVDPSCEGRACASRSVGQDGGVVFDCICADKKRAETNCNNGADDDQDGVADCADSDCIAKACASSGCFCASGRAVETICDDVVEPIDDDKDGLANCADPDCTGNRCLATDGGSGICSGGKCR